MSLFFLQRCRRFFRGTHNFSRSGIWIRATVLGVLLGGTVQGQNFENVPGVVVGYQPSPPTVGGSAVAPYRKYTASPSIVVLPNGDYVVSFNIFGADSGADVSGTTHLFRSSDKGQTWTQLPTIMDMKRGSLFVVGNDLYIFGYRAAPGDMLIRKSTDGGMTWSTPTNTSNGLIRTGSYGGTPSNPVIYDGRIWIAQSGTRVVSAPVDANLLLSSSWTLSNSANVQNGPLGSGLTITEAQIFASPEKGVVLMPKVGGLPNSVLLHATSPSNLKAPTAEDWVSLPGGEKKFGGGYDPVSGRYFILSNPVLPAHADSGLAPELIRNTGALLSSKDMVHWDVEQIFLYSPNIGYEAFQYFNFAIDGDDMVIASRTAFDVGENKPPRGHDSNLITFHRIEDFREATPRHFLTIQGNQVLRHEQTQHLAAPLGSFIQGTSFAGTALGTVTGIAKGPGGDVYVREQGGRVLRFDALGNFIEVGEPTEGLVFQTGPLEIEQPVAGERGWIRAGDGDWGELTNWHYWGRPDTDYEVANFGSAIEGNATVTLNQSITLKGMRFRSDSRYTISGDGSIRLAADEGRPIMEASRGIHYLDVPVVLAMDAEFRTQSNAAIRFRDTLDLGGQTVFLSGSGRIYVDGHFEMNGGVLVVDGSYFGDSSIAPFTFGNGASALLNGTIELRLPEGTVLQGGSRYNLINGMGFVDGQFANVVLPELGPGLEWDVSMLNVNGFVSVIALPVPEPGIMGALRVAGLCLGLRFLVRKRRG